MKELHRSSDAARIIFKGVKAYCVSQSDDGNPQTQHREMRMTAPRFSMKYVIDSKSGAIVSGIMKSSMAHTQYQRNEARCNPTMKYGGLTSLSI
jgi:hypothetical protein